MNGGQVSQLVIVDDLDDPRLSDFRMLRDVSLRTSLEAEHGLFIAEGEKVISRALDAGYATRSFLLARRWIPGLADRIEASQAPCYVMSEDQIERVTGFHVHRGALASMHRPAPRAVSEVLAEARGVGARSEAADRAAASCSEAPEQSSPASRSSRSRIVVLEGLVDHGNVGSAFRNAAALGVDAVLVTPTCADPLYRRAIKTSMGNVFKVPWTRTGETLQTLDLLRAHGYTTVALTLSEDAITLDELVERGPRALALIFGTEGAGVDPWTARQADLRVRIPMEAGVDSLNVAAATAVTFYATR